VDSTGITQTQAAKLGQTISRQLRYLGKLRTRMEQLGFPPTDPLYQQVCAAFNHVHGLNVAVHYLSCNPGAVGRN
jgi:hypothetical protein